MTDRGVSVTVGYALNIAIATLLLSGLFIAAGGLLQSERERAATAELDVIGQHLAAELGTADRMVLAGSDPSVQIRVDLPREVAGSSYSVALTEDAIELETARPRVAISVPIETTTAIKSTTVSGGQLTIEGDSDQLEVHHR